MNLKEFIKETLMEIMTGVEGAQTDLDAASGEIIGVNAQRAHQEVHFDVAVTTSSSTEGGGKISVMGFGDAGVEGKSSTEAVSRIQFTVPVKFPTQ